MMLVTLVSLDLRRPKPLGTRERFLPLKKPKTHYQVNNPTGRFDRIDGQQTSPVEALDC